MRPVFVGVLKLHFEKGLIWCVLVVVLKVQVLGLQLVAALPAR